MPVDGSENCLRALEYLAKRAQTLDEPTEILVLNAQPPVAMTVPVAPEVLDEHYSRESEAALQSARRFLERRKMQADIHVVVGDPAPTIVDLARRAQCSEIVIGTRGFGSLKGLLLGSVTTKVIHLAEIPVVVVP